MRRELPWHSRFDLLGVTFLLFLLYPIYTKNPLKKSGFFEKECLNRIKRRQHAYRTVRGCRGSYDLLQPNRSNQLFAGG